MKYILWPPFVVLLLIFVLIYGMVKMLWSLVWHFRVMPMREAYSDNDGEYLFEDWSWKEFIRDILICPSGKDEEEESCKK
jgi:hypothetical protein